jgi:hypothetical protein
MANLTNQEAAPVSGEGADQPLEELRQPQRDRHGAPYDHY